MIIREFNNIELARASYGNFTVKNLETGFNLNTKDLKEAKRAWINQVFELDQDSTLFPLDYNIMSLDKFKKDIATLNTCKLIGWSADEKHVIFNDIWQAWEVDLNQKIAFTSFEGDRLDNAITIINGQPVGGLSFVVSEIAGSRPQWYIRKGK